MPLPAGYVSNAGITVKGLTKKFSRLYHQVLTAPAAAALNNLKLAVAGPVTSTITYRAVDGTLDGALVVAKRAVLDYARNVVITVTHGAAVVALSGVITGKDIYGDLMTEAWSVTAGGVSKTYTGVKAFKEIISISVTSVADASTDTVTAGTGQVFGVDFLTTFPAIIKEVVDGGVVTTGTLVTGVHDATHDVHGTYSPATAPNGVHNYEFVVLCDSPEDS